MNGFQHYTVDDFLQDPSFVECVQNPSVENEMYWQQWIQEHPGNKNNFDKAVEIIKLFDTKKEGLHQSFYTGLKNRIDQTLQSRENRTRKWYSGVLKIAASFLAVILIASLFYKNNKTAILYCRSSYGEVKNLTLPDGSEVILNANTELRYSVSREKDREVWLTGEAAFKVAHIEKDNRALKFIVHSGHMKIEVLGTEFTVNNREKEQDVILVNGKVRLSDADSDHNAVVLKPKQKAVFDADSKNFSVKTVDPSMLTAWTRHQYILDKTPVFRICKQLQDFYGKEWMIEEAAIARKQVSGTLELQKEASVVQTLSTLLGVAITANNKTVVIHSK